MQVREVQAKLSAHPISHENVLAWALQGDNIESGVKDELLARTEGSLRDMAPFERWLSGSSAALHEPYREHITLRIASFCTPIPPEEEEALIAHEMSDWLTSDEAQRALKSFTRAYL